MTQKSKYPLIESCNPTSCISSNMMKCNRIVANIFRKHLKPFGITDSQLSILFIVTKMEGANQKKLSTLLYLEKSTVSRNIVRLVDNGYIAKDALMVLHTTEAGKQFLETVIPHWNAAMEETKRVLEQEGTKALNLVLHQLTK